tara:strand:+ start:1368 stop:1844 length:477 start_codon:yes stop_codon:yes gene_type:complete
MLKKKRNFKFLLVNLILTTLLFFFSVSTQANELLYKFKSPSFSGINSSSHYLTIENQEATRRAAIKEEIDAYTDELAREAENTTLARFIRNLESRIYASLSRQLVDQLFGETPQQAGSLTLEGNTIEYVVEEETITLTITDGSGGTTNITVPIGSFTF